MFRSKRMYLQSQAIYEKQLALANESFHEGSYLLNRHRLLDNFDEKFNTLKFAADKFNMGLVVQSKDEQREGRMGLLAVYRAILGLLMNEQNNNVANGISYSGFIMNNMAHYIEKIKSVLDRFPSVDVEELLQDTVEAHELLNLAEINESHAIYQCALGTRHETNIELTLALAAFNKAFHYFAQEDALTARFDKENNDKISRLSACNKNILLTEGKIAALQQHINKIDKEDQLDSELFEEKYSCDDQEVKEHNSDDLACNTGLVTSASKSDDEVSEANSSPATQQLLLEDNDGFVMVNEYPASPSSTGLGVFSRVPDLSTQVRTPAVANPTGSVSPRPTN